MKDYEKEIGSEYSMLLAEIGADGSLRVDAVSGGPLCEKMLGDSDHERILTIREPAAMIPYLIRESFAGRKLTFDSIEDLAREAGCKTSYWAG